MKEKQTFIVEVNDTQSHSWQGKIEWVQGRKQQSFRSVMELLRLIDSAVCDKETPGMAEEIAIAEKQGGGI